jgi:hypothetical protein
MSGARSWTANDGSRVMISDKPSLRRSSPSPVEGPVLGSSSRVPSRVPLVALAALHNHGSGSRMRSPERMNHPDSVQLLTMDATARCE